MLLNIRERMKASICLQIDIFRHVYLVFRKWFYSNIWYIYCRRFYMPDLLLVLFLFNFSLFLLHEMDAIRCSEWRLFIILKDMEDSKAYKVFTFIHLFLYVLILSLLFSQYQTIIFWVLDLFFIIHAILHLFFERHPRNEFKNSFSRSIIYPLGVLSVIHLALLISISI